MLVVEHAAVVALKINAPKRHVIPQELAHEENDERALARARRAKQEDVPQQLAVGEHHRVRRDARILDRAQDELALCGHVRWWWFEHDALIPHRNTLLTHRKNRECGFNVAALLGIPELIRDPHAVDAFAIQ